MEEDYKIPEKVYYLIAGRLLWDRPFMKILKENPEQRSEAFRKTLLEVGIKADADLLETLVAEYNKHEDNISSLSRGYFAEISPEVA